MPRETLDIALFNKGIISSPDAENPDNDSAIHSVDVENNADEGRLEGRLADKDDFLKDLGAGIFASQGQGLKSSAWITRRDGKRDLVFYGHSGIISVVTDVYGGSSAINQTDLKSIEAEKTVSLIPHNQEVHIGLGNGELDKPQWVGYMKNGRFGSAAPEAIQIADAELVFPQAFPILHKIVVDATYVYGIELNGTRIYKINRATGEITYRGGDTTFKRLTAMCDEDASFFWVFDATASTNGTIYKIAKADLTTSTTSVLGSYTLDTDAYVTDMISTTNKLWFAAYKSNIADTLATLVLSGTSVKEKWLFSVPNPPGATPTVTNNSPRFTAGTILLTDLGSWRVRPTGGTITHVNVNAVETFPLSLVKLSATKVGWVCRMPDKVEMIPGGGLLSTLPLEYYTATTPTYIKPRSTMFVVTEGDGQIFQPIIMIDSSTAGDGFRGFTGFLYDSGASALYWTRNKTIFRETGVSIPTINAAGSHYDASSPTNSTALTYDEAVSAQSTDIFLTRIAGTAGVDSVTTALGSYTAVLEGGQVTLAPSTTATNSFSENTKYYWKVCFIYDGYQYGPLSTTVLATQTNGSGTKSATSLLLSLRDTVQLNPRISDIAIFRSRSPSTDASPDEFYRQVRIVSLNDSNWTVSGSQAAITVLDEVEDIGQHYEAITGVPETLETTMVNYELSCSLNNQLFVAKCYKKELVDASHFVFKSKAGRYDTFNWIETFLRVSVLPTAIAAYANRIWLFAESQTFLINPEGLYIEEIYDGIGADNARSVMVTENGMYVCNKNSIWVCDGRKFVSISKAIETKATSISGTVSWRDIDHTYYGPFVILNAKKNCVLFVVSINSTGDNSAFVFNYTNNRWDYWQLKSSSDGSSTTKKYTGGVTGKNGEAYFANWNLVQQIQGDVTRKTFTWISKLFGYNDESQIKKVYKIITQSEGTAPTVDYAKDNATSFTNLSGTTLPAGDRRVRSFMIKITGATTTKIRSISTILRHLIGKR